MSDGEPEWISVAAAAVRLGIAERQARRYAAKLPDTDRTTDRTLPNKPRLLVRWSSLSEIVEASGSGRRGSDKVRTNDRTQSQEAVSLAVAYEQVIMQQRERIADLQAALEHERQQSRLHAETAARAQALLSLVGPVQQREPWWRRWFSGGKKSNIT